MWWRENDEILEPIAGSPREHFCYPSGRYELSQLPWLEKLGVRSATTVEPGFCYPGTSKMMMPRILDSEDLSDIEFEAELCGFIELTRRLRSRLRSPRGDIKLLAAPAPAERESDRRGGASTATNEPAAS